MGFLKKLTGIFGFGHNDGGHGVEDGDNTGKVDKLGDGDQPRFRETGLPRKGFGVPVQVAVERSNPGPILQPCPSSDGVVHVCLSFSPIHHV